MLLYSRRIMKTKSKTPVEIEARYIKEFEAGLSNPRVNFKSSTYTLPPEKLFEFTIYTDMGYIRTKGLIKAKSELSAIDILESQLEMYESDHIKLSEIIFNSAGIKLL